MSKQIIFNNFRRIIKACAACPMCREDGGAPRISLIDSTIAKDISIVLTCKATFKLLSEEARTKIDCDCPLLDELAGVAINDKQESNLSSEQKTRDEIPNCSKCGHIMFGVCTPQGYQSAKDVYASPQCVRLYNEQLTRSK
jgi:hypothetical protein